VSAFITRHEGWFLLSDMPICPPGPHTHSVAEACALLGCSSPDWLVDRVRNGTFPARKIVRELRFSDGDIARIIEVCAVQSGIGVVPELTDRSRRKVAA
jgi:hypothetical protein